MNIFHVSKVLMLFPMLLKLFTHNVKILSSIALETESISLGHYTHTIVIPCISNTMYFIKLPIVSIYSEDMKCVSLRDLRYQRMRNVVRTSGRRICLNNSGNIVTANYTNNYVLVFWNEGEDDIVHKVDGPAKIEADERHVYIVQVKYRN